jgi:hypothetical protein
MQKDMRKKWIIIATIIGTVLISAVAVGPIMSDVETPEYEVVKSDRNIEIRLYEPMIIAKVLMDGKREDAIGDGFRLLADYIFGNNTVKQYTDMASLKKKQQKGTTIAMTAPVQQQSADSSWQVSFVMPSKHSMKELPKPGNDRVTLKEIPAKQFIVITFSGMNSDANVKKYEDKLMQYIKTNDILFVGSPKYAFYNPPWTLPPMRRNEIMIEIEQ